MVPGSKRMDSRSLEISAKQYNLTSAEISSNPAHEKKAEKAADWGKNPHFMRDQTNIDWLEMSRTAKKE